ncbi:hypothetical protein B0H16DRAFT_1723053 [Mycena metata]|uniref:Uncharacterized protein n=1 Tax=Mycena metata TaxID=1033252 RepID=A0AAD7J0Y4_9AGAR|nr:hypothetical protein B0H16DRAFT_1723053 [Mycena metata]
MGLPRSPPTTPPIQQRKLPRLRTSPPTSPPLQQPKFPPARLPWHPDPVIPPKETFPHINTPQSFLEMGIEIQHAQRVLKYKLDANKDPEPYMFVRLDSKKTALKERIAEFRTLQRRFMPNLHTGLTTDQRRDLANEDSFGVPAMRLYLPSSLDVEQRRKVCSDTLIEWETELRDQEVRLAESQIEFANIKRRLAICALKRVRHGDFDSRDEQQDELRRARFRHSVFTTQQKLAKDAAKRLRASVVA